ncbi:MAG: hypothetical protein IJ537_00585 [Bacteroidaceae bacterium]|nr:hypothetical protein [Bacteroidaceae bacterium]MBQ8453829.1 hypothetical protein [Bacteroidaceae bacterium]MBQ9169208.1 hypothetical protein [Bacteroidaceae bacterium]MBQ9294496.1 hypothetical protein [Bacteroidaceae bacterium]
MNTRLLSFCLLLLMAADALSQCKYCNSYEDFVNDKWQPLDTLYSKKHGKGYVFMWGVGGYKLTTGDKATDATIKKSFAAMQGKTLFVNGHRLKCGKQSMGKGFCKAARINRYNIVFTSNIMPADYNSSQMAGAMAASLGVIAGQGGAIGGAVAGLAGGIVGGTMGGVQAFKSMKHPVCHIVAPSSDDEKQTTTVPIDDKLMDKFLLSRNLTKLHDKYYAEKDKDKRMQASRVIPILEKAGIIEAEE